MLSSTVYLSRAKSVGELLGLVVYAVEMSHCVAWLPYLLVIEAASFFILNWNLLQLVGQCWKYLLVRREGGYYLMIIGTCDTHWICVIGGCVI